MKPPLNTAELFTPGRLGPYTLPHRVLMAPMTRNRARRDGVPSPSAVIYYAQRASAGMIVTETTTVSEQAVGYPFMPGIHTADQVAGWSRWWMRYIASAAASSYNSFTLAAYRIRRCSPEKPSPSHRRRLLPTGRRQHTRGRCHSWRRGALRWRRFRTIVEQFRVAAHNALLAGFDGVEIHGANGYLLDQFLRDGSNQRTDAYGGSVANRIRLLLQVTEAVADVWGADRVGVRISPLNGFNSMFDSDPRKTFGAVVTELAGFGLAYLHVVEEDGAPESGRRFDIGSLRNLWNGPYIVNGNYDSSRAMKAIADRRADFVSFGKLFLANPDLPLRFARSAPLNVPDRGSFYGGDDRGIYRLSLP